MKIPAHGGRIFEAAAALNRPWQEIIDFSANINPLGPPEGLKEHLFDNFDLILHYPETHGQSLAGHLAEAYKLNHEQVFVGSGSTVQMHFLMRRLHPENPIIVGPAFGEYEGALKTAGIKARYVTTREEDNWEVTEETLSRLWAANPDLIFIANPANPTGRTVKKTILDQLVKIADEKKIWLVIDEAFIDFTSEFDNTLINQVADNPRLIILKSLTKIYALPGLRLAFMAVGREAVGSLEGGIEPWSVSALALEAGFFCLKQQAFLIKTRSEVEKLRTAFMEGLTALNIAKIYPGQANYILIRLNNPSQTDSLLQSLFKKGILARNAANFNGLEAGYLRLAVRPAQEAQKLLKAL